jgi:hypothetical protein
MAKFITKDLITAVFLGILLVGITGIVNAQQALPTAGNSFETAAEIKAGSYKGGTIENKEAEYFYVVVKAGEEINVKAIFTAANIEVGAWAILALYDKDRTELAVKDDGFYDKPLSLAISWLHRGKDSDKYYIKTECDAFKIGSYLLDVSLTPTEKKEEKEIAPAAPVAPVTPSVEKKEEGAVPSIAEEGAAGEAAPKGPNWTLILGIIAIVVVVGVVAYSLLKKKRKE